MIKETIVIVDGKRFIATFWGAALLVGLALFVVLSILPEAVSRATPPETSAVSELWIVVLPGNMAKTNFGQFKVFESKPGQILLGHVNAKFNDIYYVEDGGYRYPVFFTQPTDPTGLLEVRHNAPCTATLTLSILASDGTRWKLQSPCR